MSGLAKLAEGHAQAQALRAVRVAAGDRRLAVDHLTILAARDPALASGLLQLGIAKAVRDALADFDRLASTAGRFTACHP